ncbi:MAG TPA: hypothetical protein VMF35_09700 [Acidimicrobiales bacterium]|nr:hypothetical protein [Acidimicrobiales bacterium]
MKPRAEETLIRQTSLTRRTWIPLLAVGALALLTVVAAVLGVRHSSSSGATNTGVADSRTADELKLILERTTAVSSLSEHVKIFQTSGEESEGYVYNAPDKLEIFNPPSHQPVIVVVGRTEYTINAAGSGWSAANSQRFGEVKGAVLGYVAAFEKSRSVTRSHQTFTALAQYHGWPLPDDENHLVATFQTSQGYATAIRIVLRSTDPHWPGETLEIGISSIDRSPAIAAPSPVLGSSTSVPTTGDMRIP